MRNEISSTLVLIEISFLFLTQQQQHLYDSLLGFISAKAQY